LYDDEVTEFLAIYKYNYVTIIQDDCPNDYNFKSANIYTIEDLHNWRFEMVHL
jgi:hypothetical protein